MPKTKRDLTEKEIALVSQLVATTQRRIGAREIAKRLKVNRHSVVKSLLRWQEEYDKAHPMPSVVPEK